MKKVLVYLETKDGKLLNTAREALDAVLQMEQADVTGVVIGEKRAAETASFYGVRRVMLAETNDFSSENQGELLAQIIRETGAELLVAGGTSQGRQLAARMAYRFCGTCVTNTVKMKLTENGEIHYCTPIYGGTILDHQVGAADAFQAVTVRSGAFSKADKIAKNCEVSHFPVTEAVVLHTRIVNVVEELIETIDLGSAEVIVAGGSGMGGIENFKLAEELAELLGGAVGASRPAVEENWVPRIRQIGQSGKIVAPKLYIACGISGAAQHVSAIMGSEFIVAINKDEGAPIFKIADVGIVGDVSKVLPLMIQAVKEKKV